MLLTPGQRLKASLISTVGAPAIRALCSTLRWRVEGAEHWDAIIASGHQPILALWHGRILAGLHYFRNRGVVVITSQNFDGEWIARILHRYGFGTARGSTSRGGARALVQMRRDLREGRPVAFTLDGPRGPARVIQPGAAWLAGATGHPILPYHIEADRFWTLGTWDRTQVPRPFSTVAIVFGPPLYVPSTEAGVLADKERKLMAVLGDLERRATALAGLEALSPEP